jgi:hypothetical protein
MTTATLHRCRSTGTAIGTLCNQCDAPLDDGACPLCLSCCDDNLYDCACTGIFTSPDPDCRACDGIGKVVDRNEWCDRCGLAGNCMDCDPDRFLDARRDR